MWSMHKLRPPPSSDTWLPWRPTCGCYYLCAPLGLFHLDGGGGRSVVHGVDERVHALVGAHEAVGDHVGFPWQQSAKGRGGKIGKVISQTNRRRELSWVVDVGGSLLLMHIIKVRVVARPFSVQSLMSTAYVSM